jgi:hypothetical protein
MHYAMAFQASLSRVTQKLRNSAAKKNKKKLMHQEQR